MEVMKQLRQRAIRDLVEQRPIRTQQELAAALRERGFRTTQATISRDVAELRLVKAGRDGTSVYALPPRLAEADPSGEERSAASSATCRWRSARPGTMLVLVTLPGLGARDRGRARPRPLAGGRRLDRRRRHGASSPARTAGRCVASARAWSAWPRGSRRGARPAASGRRRGAATGDPDQHAAPRRPGPARPGRACGRWRRRPPRPAGRPRGAGWPAREARREPGQERVAAADRRRGRAPAAARSARRRRPRRPGRRPVDATADERGPRAAGAQRAGRRDSTRLVGGRDARRRPTPPRAR